MDQTSVKELAEWLVERAKAMGAETAEAHVNHSREFECEVRRGELENLVEAESNGATLTVSKNKRRASVQSSDTQRDHLNSLIDKALFLCAYTDVDEAYSLPPYDRLAFDPPELDLFDAEFNQWDVTKKQAFAIRCEAAMVSFDPRIQSNGASFSTTTGYSAMANSLGFSVALATTAGGVHASGFAADHVKDGDLNTGRKQAGGWSHQVRFADQLPDPKELGRMAGADIVRLLGSRKPKTGRYPVFFDATTARSLWRHLLTAVNGSSLYRRESFLLDHLNSDVASSIITITDDPFIQRGLASHPYDDEGVACRRSEIVSSGTLNTYLLSTYSANKLGMTTTGHAGGTGNIIIQPGHQSEAEILRQIDHGVYVTSLSGQGVNISTGDYSRGAQGLWIERGEVAYPIMEFTLNGNLRHMFKSIRALSREVQPGWTILTPGILIDEMAVSGL